MKIVDLPYYINSAYVDDDGNIYLGELTNNVSTVRKFTSIEEITQSFTENYRPGKPEFMDHNYSSGLLTGGLTFTPARNEDAITQYQVYFVDQDNNKINSPIAYVNKSSIYGGKYSVELNSVPIPSGARKLAIYSYMSSTINNYDGYYSVPSTTAIWDMPNVVVQSAIINDTAASNNEISGTLTWNNALSQNSDDTYEIYFSGNGGFIGNSIGDISATKTEYLFNIPEHTAIPSDALALGIVLKSADGDISPWYTFVPIYKKISMQPTTEQIVIVNNPAGADDTVTVSSLKEGDIVKVFNYNFDEIGRGTVANGKSSAIVSIMQLDRISKYVFVSVTSLNKLKVC